MQFFNSKECEWADMEAFIGGKSVTKIRGVRYKVSQEKEQLHAAGKKAISIQSGNEMCSGELKLLKGAIDDLNRAAHVAGGTSILDTSFDLVITFVAKGSRSRQVDTCIGVEISDFEKGWDQGAKYMEVTAPFVCLDIISS